jgi:hypothetical protein
MKRISGVNRRRSWSYLATGILISIISLLFSAMLVGALAKGLFDDEPKAPVNPGIMVSPHLLWQYNVLVALNPADCTYPNGMTIYGNGITTINGGGILANGCLRGNGNAGAVEIEPPFKPLGRDLNPGNLNWNPPPEYFRSQIDLQIDFSDQAEEACSELPMYGLGAYKRNRDRIISPGNYPSIIVTDTLTMLPGLYCLAGDFTVYNEASLSGQGVTIYMSDGDFTIFGNAEMHLAAAPEGVRSDPIWKDLLLYVANYHDATVSLVGSIGSSYHGVIYAPASDIDVTGAGLLQVQLIGWNVEVGGTNDIEVGVDFWPGLPRMKAGRE